MIAEKDGVWIGKCHVVPKLESPTVGMQWLTGVLKDHRGHGVATALKVRSYERARAAGVTVMTTEDKPRRQRKVPMLRPQKRKTPGRKETKHKAAQAINRKFGFIPEPSVVVYNKKYAYLFAPTEPLSEDAARYRWDFRRGWDFRRDVELLRGGDHTKMEMAIAFLEADPWFQGSGYDKVRLIRYIKPAMLKPGHIKRLQGVVVSLVDRRDDRDFRAFCKLARKVDGPALREQLTQRLTSGDPDIRRRARWVLEALAQKNRMEKRT